MILATPPPQDFDWYQVCTRLIGKHPALADPRYDLKDLSLAQIAMYLHEEEEPGNQAAGPGQFEFERRLKQEARRSSKDRLLGALRAYHGT